MPPRKSERDSEAALVAMVDSEVVSEVFLVKLRVPFHLLFHCFHLPWRGRLGRSDPVGEQQGLTGLGARVPPGCAVCWLCSCRTVAFFAKASLGSSVRGWVPLRRKEVHRFSLEALER